MSKINIGIDVDMTTLASDEAWWRWLDFMSNGYSRSDPVRLLNKMKKSGKPLNYDLSSYFPDMINENVTPMDFWRNEGIYDTICPVPGATRVIEAFIRDPDLEVTFVTHNKGNHGRSKFNNLCRLFGRGNFNMIVTKEKHLVRMDVLIDDRLNFLNPCAELGVKCFLIGTPYTQTVIKHNDVIEMPDWYTGYGMVIDALYEK